MQNKPFWLPFPSDRKGPSAHTLVPLSGVVHPLTSLLGTTCRLARVSTEFRELHGTLKILIKGVLARRLSQSPAPGTKLSSPTPGSSCGWTLARDGKIRTSRISRGALKCWSGMSAAPLDLGFRLRSPIHISRPLSSTPTSHRGLPAS